MRPENNSGNMMEKAAGRLTNVVLLGFFGFVFSLPIVTFGPAMTAVNAATKDYLIFDNQKPLRCFFSTYKEKFMLSLKVWLIELVAIGILVWDFVYYRTGNQVMDILGQTAVFVLALLLLFTTIFSFVVIAEDLEDQVLKVMKRALDISFTSFFRSLAVVFITVSTVVAAIYLFRGTIIFLPGIQAFMSYQFIPKILKDAKYKRGNAVYQRSRRK